MSNVTYALAQQQDYRYLIAGIKAKLPPHIVVRISDADLVHLCKLRSHLPVIDSMIANKDKEGFINKVNIVRQFNFFVDKFLKENKDLGFKRSQFLGLYAQGLFGIHYEVFNKYVKVDRNWDSVVDQGFIDVDSAIMFLVRKHQQSRDYNNEINDINQKIVAKVSLIQKLHAEVRSLTERLDILKSN